MKITHYTGVARPVILEINQPKGFKMEVQKQIETIMKLHCGNGCPSEYGLDDHPGCNVDYGGTSTEEMEDDSTCCMEKCWPRALSLMLRAK